MQVNNVNSALSKYGNYRILKPNEPLIINKRDRRFGVIYVTEGTVSLASIDETTGEMISLVKHYKKGQLILLDLIKEKCFDETFSLACQGGASRIIYADSGLFIDYVTNGSATMLKLLKNSAECIALMVNRSASRKNLSPIDFYAAVLMNQIKDLRIKCEKNTTDIKIHIKRSTLAAVTGFGERTIRRAHQDLLQQGVIKDSSRKSTIIVDYDLLSLMVADKKLERLAL